MDRKKIKLNKATSKSEVNINNFGCVNFVGNNRELPPGEINHILDVGEQFNVERRACHDYRFIFTITPIFSNPLHNPYGKEPQDVFVGGTPDAAIGNGLNIFDNILFKSKAFANPQFQFSVTNLDYVEAVDEFFIERDGWFGFNDPDVTATGITRFYDIEPSRARFSLNSDIKKNWDICITYPESSDNNHHLVNNGLLVVNIETDIEVGGRKMLALGTATRHGLSRGDKVILTSLPTGISGKHTVRRLGLDNGDLPQNYFVIDVNPDDNNIDSQVCEGRMKRVLNGYESEYYVRMFKKFENIDYSIYPLAFSKTIYNDKNHQLTFNKNINVEGIKDNLGRPLSEVFLTFVKTKDQFTVGDINLNYMSEIKSGFDLELLSGNILDTNLSNIRRIHNGGSTPFQSHIPLESDLVMGSLNEPDTFYGDIVEYNKTELKENVLSDVLHRYNTSFRDMSTQSFELAKGPRYEGYMYKAHHRVKIRLYSIFIEEGYLETTGNIPDYAEILDGNKYVWRDFLSIGVSRADGETLDYPFTNNSHYVYDNICFIGKRQDPFNQYGLYYSGDLTNNDPPDARGETITDKFITKGGDEIC